MNALIKIAKAGGIALALILLLSGNAFSQCLTFNVTDVSCNGGSDGSVTITINNVGAKYNFSVFGAFGSRTFNNSVSNTHTFTNLPAEPNLIIVGQYKVAGSFLSCPPFFGSINEPADISVTGTVTDILCNGGNTGAIDITPVGGNPGGYTYSWNSGQTTEDISGLTAGTYTVIVTDTKSCKDTTSYTVNQQAPITIPGSITDVKCNGGNTGAIDITPAGGTPGPYTYSWSNGSSTQDISALTAGIYSVTVTDANSCSQNASFTVNQPPVISIPGSITNVTCNGGNNGSVDITPAGGTPGYTYLWSNGAVTQDISALTAGVYSVTITDANLCPQNASFTVNEPAAISIPGVITHNICNGGNIGSIDITPAGGTGAYTYLWSNGAVTQDISALTAGTYSVTVKDANLCSQNASFTVNEPTAISISGNVTDLSCNGGNNGAVDITPAGGTGAYTYLWSNGAVTQDIAGLTAGIYSVTVKDANLCSKNTSFTVNQPSLISVPGTTVDVSCNGGSNGSIDITPAGGTPAYTYLWNNGAVSQDIAGLVAGIYSVTVTDANLCSKNVSFTINQPAAALSVPGTTVDVSCNGGSNGSIDITPAGGTVPYTYLWSNGAITQDISALAAGIYSVTVTDFKSCTKNVSFTINQPAAITVPGTTVNVSCNGGSNGSIDITPAGGTVPYTYLWSNGPVTQDISALAAGVYSVTVTDAKSCTKNVSFTITQPAAITIPGVKVNVSCNGGNNGSIDITPAGGTPGYTYLWSNGAVTQDIAGLTTGTYTVTVKDANLCSQNASFTITQPAALSVPGTTLNVSCNGGNNGSVDITPAGGTAPYTYLWSNGQVTQDISALTAGIYSVTVTDANGCTKNVSFTITQPAIITVPGTTVDVSCNGGSNGSVDITPSGGTPAYTYLWSNGAVTQDIAGLTAGIYSVTLTDSKGCTKNVSFTINQPTPIAIPGSVTNASCNGGNNGAVDITPAGGTGAYTYLWSNGAVSQDIAGLTAGIYSVTVKDANLCSKNASFTVNQPAVISIPGSTTNVSCNGGNNGAVDITPAGGTGPYTYLWSNGAVTQDIAGIVAGIYSVTVTDANLCSQNASFNVNQPSVISIPGIVTNTSCNGGNNGSVNITPAGGTGAYTYLWSNGAVSQNIAGLTAGIYSVTVTDANLCSQNASFTVNEPAVISIPGTTTDNICHGGNIGAVDITPAGGTGAYTYLWSNGAVTQDISALTAGIYSVTVKDANLCSQNASFTINEPSGISIPGSVTDPTCNGGNNGAVDITPSGGTGAYTYLWSNGAVSQDIAGLTAGIYSVTVKDANLCPQNASFTVNNPTAITIPGSVTNASCNGGNNGAIDITPANGTGPGTYTYLWNNGAVTEDIAGLVTGIYTVTVTDANLCSQNASFTVNQPAVISVSGSVTDVTCNGGNNGAVDIIPAGGTGAYTYLWSNGAVSQNIAGLTAGIYSVTVTDANLCSQNASFTVNEPAVISIPGTTTDNICHGGNIGAVDITPAGGTGAYTYLWSNGAVTQDISALTAGIYSVTVKDANLCSQNASFTINEPSGISIPGSVTDPTCNGGNNGAVDITPSGGTGAYTYLWSNGAVSQDIAGLTAGIYSVTVKDANLCPQNASFTVNNPTAITIPGSVTNASCNGGNNGAIDITPANGTGPGTYTYLWNNGAVTEDIAGLVTGIYTVTVTDANLCSQNASFTVNQATNITVSGNVTDATCNAGNNGAVDITPAGGTGVGTYTFVWSNGAATEDISALTAGIYSVTVTDANLCSQNASFTVNEPAVISIPGNTTDNICNGGNIGAVDITPSGGTGTYTYLWSNGTVTQDISALTAGIYSVTVTDANLCSQNASFTINEPAVISIPGSVTDATCNGGNNGAVDITPAGGTGAYTYLWSNGVVTQDISSVAAGVYSVTVTDVNLCSQNASFTVNQATLVTGTFTANPDTVCLGDPSMVTATLDPAFTPNANAYSFDGGVTFGPVNTLNIASINSDTTVTVILKDVNGCLSSPIPAAIVRRHFVASVNLINPLCNGTNTGSISINSVTGGTAGYTYTLNGAPGVSFNSLIAGSYVLSITDALSCRFDTTLTLTDPAILDLAATFVSPICFSGNNGVVNLTGTGGSGTYTYSDDNITFGASASFSGLNPGTYTYYVKDGNGCIDSVTAVFASFPPINISSINASIIDLTCNGVNTGQIHLSNITGGNRPLTFSLNAGIAQSDSNFVSLSAGNYVITITDANGCSFDYDTVVNSPFPINFNLAITQFETCNNADGIIQMSNVTGGIGPYTYSFNGGASSSYAGVPVNFGNLPSAIYSVRVFDSSTPGCSLIKNILLPKKPGPIPYVRVTDPLCFHGNDGQIRIDSLQGGVPLFSLTLTGTNLGKTATFPGVTSAVFNGLAKDSFQLVVTDQECVYPIFVYYLYNEDSLYYDTLVYNYIQVGEPDSITAQAFSSNTDRHLSTGDGFIYDIQGGTGPYSYSMNLAGPYIAMPTDTTMLTGLSQGHYKAYIKDANGCLGIVEFDIRGSFFIPNMISPNGDNHNDVFEVIGLPRESELRVYNRWGTRVYENKSYDNSWNGDTSPDGVYYYDLKLPNATVYKGWVEIVR
jgi:gliding motility-associated-like protein